MVILSQPSQNILRNRGKSKKPMIIMLSIMFVIFFLLVSLGIYSVLNYSYENNITIQDMKNFQLLTAISNMFSFDFSLPFGIEIIKQILKIHLSLWWVYLIVAALIWIMFLSADRNDFKGMEHGSAKWADDELIEEFSNPENAIPVAKDFYVPIDGSKTANLNEIMIGGSGAGKTFRGIKPHIMQILGSYVVTDPKGELYRDLSRMLTANGYKVRVLNLKDLHYSNSYNPFVYLKSEQDVFSLSDLFMKNTKGDGEKEDFWSGDAQKILSMLMLYLFKDDTEIKSFGRVVRLVNSVAYADNQIDMSCELARCMNKHAVKYPNDFGTISWTGFQGLPQETMASVLEVLSNRLTLFATTDLDAITSTNEMDFDMVGVEKTVIFLILPAARNTYKAISNIFYTQLFERLMYIADTKYNGCLPLLVSCEMDEFANIGEVPSFNEILSVVRSYNIRICIVLQGISQLKAIYEKTYEAIIGNCDIFTFLGSKDKDTLDYVSAKLDKITVRGDSRSFNRGMSNGGGGQDTEAYIERPLLYPNEIKKAIKPKGKNRKYGGCCIVFVGYEDPVYLPKFDTPSHPRFVECGSKHKEYVHNCTDVSVVYMPIWTQRLIEYHKMYDKHNTQSKEELKAYEEEVKIQNEQEQAELEAEFERNNVQIELPANEEPSEEEYEEYCESVDNGELPPVQDFSDEPYEDDFMFDISPVVEKIKEMQQVNE